MGAQRYTQTTSGVSGYLGDISALSGLFARLRALLAQALKVDSLTAIRYRTEAVGHLQKAVTIHPTYKNAWLLLGIAFYYLNNFDQAIQQVYTFSGGLSFAVVFRGDWGEEFSFTNPYQCFKLNP